MPDDTPNTPDTPHTPLIIDATDLIDPKPVYGIAQSIGVLDSYRGPGTGKGAGLKITLVHDPDRLVVIVLMEDVMEKLQADEDYGRG